MTGAFRGAGPWQRMEEKREHPVTILVIEDEPMVREVLQITLERSGFRVLMAGGGDEALDLCESSPEPIDLVLTDIVMPGTSGADLRFCRSRLPGSSCWRRCAGRSRHRDFWCGMQFHIC